MDGLGHIEALDRHVVGRSSSMFAEDLEQHAARLGEVIRDRRLLLIGGAGSIGAQTIRTIVGFGPAAVHVIDQNENGLAELVRDLRSSSAASGLRDFQTLPFDVGGEPFRLWLGATGGGYDAVLNFAALKHVRSEKDPFSTLAMLQTNVVHLDRLARLLAGQRRLRRVFSVSTDKAANPSSMMGATKRLMEHALFLPGQPWPDGAEITSARFANVAFSNGSLLQSWQRRIANGQPLACPEDTRRFFVSLVESGHLCTLAGFLGTARTISVPTLEPDTHLVLMSDVATRFLDFHGYEPYATHDEQEALGRVEELRATGRWPLLLTPLDTGGEKPYEEFVGANETVADGPCSALREIGYVAPADQGSFRRLVGALESLLASNDPSTVTTDALKRLVATVEPSFAGTHHASVKSLDDRM